ncbi:MAG TPA: N-acetyl-gamma-glutamyl-phosphate reductase [Flavitalea sp.]|nr:N-acetyl-gamma-glutamyl-phosphate reductase [Flavitalea sp.]
MNPIKIGIAGGAGYTGGELIRLLLNHPQATISFIHSTSNAGKKVGHVHADLLHENQLEFSATVSDDIDVLFLCVGHGDAKKFLSQNPVSKNVKVIDLSQDFRLFDNTNFEGRNFTYGLPELNRKKISSSTNIANPGCFATCIQLGLLPLAHAGLLKKVYTTGITGSTGAGQSLSSSTHFSWRANNIQAYKTLTHQHLAEIIQSLEQLQPDGEADISFVPWRGDFTRGIFVTSQLDCNVSENELLTLFENYYSGHPFTTISREPISLKQVVNTNHCYIHLEKAGNKLAVHSIIDNLLKGASGQAIQNMNLMFGLEETTGLRLKANYF